MTASCSCNACRATTLAASGPNPPGRDAIALRAGTHATFLDAMKLALSSAEHRAGLAGLLTRASSDPSIATLDAWATIADVLTFYQERFGNEGYLRTARDPRSLTELARLIGYEARPGVSASVHLAYTVDDTNARVRIPAGTRAQSIPGGPDEQAQTFETSSELEARQAWNNLQVRLTRPQRISVERLVDVRANRRHDKLVIAEDDPHVIYVQGVTSNLKANDKLLFVASEIEAAAFATIEAIVPEPAQQRTRIELVAPREGALSKAVQSKRARAVASQIAKTPLLNVFANLLKSTSKPPSVVPSRARLPLTAASNLTDANGDAAMRLLTAVNPDAAQAAFRALESAEVTAPLDVSVYALTRATLFGANAPKARAPAPVVEFGDGGIYNVISPVETEWKMPRVWSESPRPSEPGEIEINLRACKTRKKSRKGSPPSAASSSVRAVAPGTEDDASTVVLDGAFEMLKPQSWLVLETQDTLLTQKRETVLQVGDVRVAPRAAFGLAGRTTRAQLLGPTGKYTWLAGLAPAAGDDYDPNDGMPIEPDDEPGGEPDSTHGFRFDAIRRSVVYLAGAQLTLAEVPDASPVPSVDPEDPESGTVVPLNAVYSGFNAGRWVVFSGERADVAAELPVEQEPTSGDLEEEEPAPQNETVKVKADGVRQSELALVLGVRHEFDPDRPGDRVRSSLVLAEPLAYAFKRETLRIYGNVVDATHGETRNEVLGGGDATIPNQSFALRQPPLTYVAAATTSGVKSTLEVTVNGARFREVAALSDAGPRDRAYIVRSDESGKTTITFGDGIHGARLPSGRENVAVRYRNGLGSAGNVKAGQISTALDKPLGVREVINPLRASGGADRDRANVLRRNAPASVRALDRLVSIADYADFASTFAGIGKASALELSDGVQELVHVTIAGIDDVPILSTSDLFRSFNLALRRFGDPQLPLRVAVRKAFFLLIDARIELDGTYAWETVQPNVVRALFDRFSFDRLELGSAIHDSQVLATILSVPGVRCADLSPLLAIPSDSESFAAAAESGAPIGLIDVQLARAIRTNELPWKIEPAAIAYLSPNVPESVTLKEKSP